MLAYDNSQSWSHTCYTSSVFPSSTPGLPIIKMNKIATESQKKKRKPSLCPRMPPSKQKRKGSRWNTLPCIFLSCQQIGFRCVEYGICP
jgi:hypothetical protein